MLKKITNNFWWKLLSVVLAFLAWLTIVNIEDPQISRTFYDIPVEKINIEAIESEKMAIEYLEGEKINVRVQGKRSLVDTMSINDIVAYADLEKKSITDAVEIVVEVPDSISIVEKEPNMMMVELENIITVQKGVQPYMEGEPKEGYIYKDAVVVPNNIEVEGPESKINLIKSVLVPVNIEGVTRDVTLYRSPKIIDASNNEISGLSVSIGQIQIQVPIEKLGVVELKMDIDETVSEGYELIGLTLSQSTMEISGDESTIDNLESLTISGISLDGLTEDTVINVNTNTILPDGVSRYGEEEPIQIYVDLEPIEEKSITITHGDINTRQIPENLLFSFVDEETYTVTYRGIAERLDEIDMDRIAPSISLTGLEVGQHEVELHYLTPYGVEIISEPHTVLIELTEEPEEEPVEGEENPETGSTETEELPADG